MKQTDAKKKNPQEEKGLGDTKWGKTGFTSSAQLSCHSFDCTTS